MALAATLAQSEKADELSAQVEASRLHLEESLAQLRLEAEEHEFYALASLREKMDAEILELRLALCQMTIKSICVESSPTSSVVVVDPPPPELAVVVEHHSEHSGAEGTIQYSGKE